LLSQLKDGESLDVQLTGVYIAGYEISAFYDPKQPICPDDVQPSTWAELSGKGGALGELEALLLKHRRALVTVKGVLQGPPGAGPDDPKLPTLVAFANRSGGRRFGHLGMFRTRLTITDVVSAEEVPETESHSLVHSRPPREGQLAAPISAKVPEYPPLARNIGLSGAVELEVKVSNGLVVGARLLSGDRLLAGGAEADVKTWRFPETTNLSFITIFSYELERRSYGSSQNSTCELDLPSRVTVRAPLNRW
jgi:hypothetical protein